MSAELPGDAEAVILVKAAPRVGKNHGELVCCAGIEAGTNWVRLYPVAFRTLEDSQKFSRWDKIKYRWGIPTSGDDRAESRRVEHNSIEICGQLAKKDRQMFLSRLVKMSLAEETTSGKSLALVRPIEPEFIIEPKPVDEWKEEQDLFLAWHRSESEGLFGQLSKSSVPYSSAKYRFKYRYRTADGKREGTCQDWEIEATYLKWSRIYGEDRALVLLNRRFGEEYVEKGFVLAMGTHKAYPQWLINGVLRLDHGAEDQIALF